MTGMSRQPMQESGTDSKQIKDGRFLLDACIQSVQTTAVIFAWSATCGSDLLYWLLPSSLFHLSMLPLSMGFVTIHRIPVKVKHFGVIQHL